MIIFLIKHRDLPENKLCLHHHSDLDRCPHHNPISSFCIFSGGGCLWEAGTGEPSPSWEAGSTAKKAPGQAGSLYPFHFPLPTPHLWAGEGAWSPQRCPTAAAWWREGWEEAGCRATVGSTHMWQLPSAGCPQAREQATSQRYLKGLGAFQKRLLDIPQGGKRKFWKVGSEERKWLMSSKKDGQGAEPRRQQEGSPTVQRRGKGVRKEPGAGAEAAALRLSWEEQEVFVFILHFANRHLSSL